jgi:hypothetical protein
MVHPCSTNSFTQSFPNIQSRYGGDELSGDDVFGEIILVFYWPKFYAILPTNPLNP